MHTELENVLWWVWQNRKSIMAKAPKNTGGNGHGHYVKGKYNKAVSQIYNHYAGIEDSKSIGEDEINQFKADLIRCKTLLNCNQLAIQGDDGVSDAEPYFIRTMLPRDVAESFFHFRRRDGSNTHRLYINIRRRARMHAFLNLAHRAWNVPDFLCAKVSGPGSARADSAVFYFKSQNGLDQGVNALRNYAASHKQYFDPERPKLTAPINGLRGFGTGMQPPKIQIMRQAHNDFVAFGNSQSFGTYRAQIIFTALENSTMSAKYSPLQGAYWLAFKKRAKNYLEIGGIDTDHPWRQGAPKISGVSDASEVLKRISAMNDNGVKTGWPVAV